MSPSGFIQLLGHYDSTWFHCSTNFHVKSPGPGEAARSQALERRVQRLIVPQQCGAWVRPAYIIYLDHQVVQTNLYQPLFWYTFQWFVRIFDSGVKTYTFFFWYNCIHQLMFSTVLVCFFPIHIYIYMSWPFACHLSAFLVPACQLVASAYVEVAAVCVGSWETWVFVQTLLELFDCVAWSMLVCLACGASCDPWS